MRHILIAATSIGVMMAGLPSDAAAIGTGESLCRIEGVDEFAGAERRAETVGFVKRADGPVRILRFEAAEVAEIKAEIGMDIYAGDAIVTGTDGGFDVIFTDNTTLSGVGDTCIEISNYVYKAAEAEGDFRMRLGRGVVSVSAGEVAKIKGDTMSVKIRNDTNLAVTGTRIVIRAK